MTFTFIIFIYVIVFFLSPSVDVKFPETLICVCSQSSKCEKGNTYTYTRTNVLGLFLKFFYVLCNVYIVNKVQKEAKFLLKNPLKKKTICRTCLVVERSRCHHFGSFSIGCIEWSRQRSIFSATESRSCHFTSNPILNWKMFGRINDALLTAADVVSPPFIASARVDRWTRLLPIHFSLFS